MIDVPWAQRDDTCAVWDVLLAPDMAEEPAGSVRGVDAVPTPAPLAPANPAGRPSITTNGRSRPPRCPYPSRPPSPTPLAPIRDDEHAILAALPPKVSALWPPTAAIRRRSEGRRASGGRPTAAASATAAQSAAPSPLTATPPLTAMFRATVPPPTSAPPPSTAPPTMNQLPPVAYSLHSVNSKMMLPDASGAATGGAALAGVAVDARLAPDAGVVAAAGVIAEAGLASAAAVMKVGVAVSAGVAAAGVGALTTSYPPTGATRQRPKGRGAQSLPSSAATSSPSATPTSHPEDAVSTPRIRRVACEPPPPTQIGVAIFPALAAAFAGRRHHPPPSSTAIRPSERVRRVACLRPRAVPVATVARSAYEAAGVDTGEAPEGPARPTRQLHTGGRVGGAGRPADTRRDTWRTLGAGMQRAVCGALIDRGLEPVLRGLLGRSPAAHVHERIHDGLSARAREFYRGEVWPLRGIFGVLARFPAGLVGEAGSKLTPTLVTTWLTDSGTVACSCVGRVAFVARHSQVPSDATCQHAKTFRGAISYLAARLGVALSTFRRVVPPLFGEAAGEGGGGAELGPDVNEKLDWDAEGTIQAFRTGQTAVAVVLSGTGSCKVPTPVRCARKTSTCQFCDSAAGFSCVHAVRARSVRRGEPPERLGAADAAGDDTDGDGTVVDDSQSTLPLPLYNCLRSVRVDATVCSYMREGKTLVVRAPSCCPTCGSVQTDKNTKVDMGEVMCSEGYATMRMESFFCDGKDCQRWIFPDGRAQGLVILSCITASTAAIMRDMASEMVSSGSPFKACFKRWTNQFMDRRDSGAYPKMLPVKMRSRKTVTSMFFLTLELMTKEPPLWAFRCSTCQDKNGRFRIVTADGIWLGYLKRLASGSHTTPSEICTSVRAGVHAASIHPSEWVRRFLRLTLKQPSKPIVIKAGQLTSAKRALAFLCPAALPEVNESDLSDQRRVHLARLRTFLERLWDLDRATVSLVNAIVVHTKKQLMGRSALSEAVVADHQATLRHLHAWQLRLQQGLDGEGLAGGVDAVVGDDGHGGAAERGAAPIDGEVGDGDAGAVGDAPAAAGAVGGGQQAGGAAAAVPAAALPAAAARQAGGAGGARAARRPAEAAQRHHMDRSTSEPLDPRCLRDGIKALGRSVYRDIISFAIAVTIDPVVNAFKPRHVTALSKLSNVLLAGNGRTTLQQLMRRVALDPEPQPPPDTADTQLPLDAANVHPPPVPAEAVHPAGVGDALAVAAGDDGQPPIVIPDPPPEEEARPADLSDVVALLKESRMLYCFLVAIRASVPTFAMLAAPVSDVLLSVRAAIEDFHAERDGKDGTAAAYKQRWGDETLAPSELRARFVAEYPSASDDPAVTGAWFPGRLMCRPAAFSPAEEAELGTCSKNYQDVHKFFSPGTFTICCACAHPKMLGFVVLDKREGPPALLNALLSYFALLPHFVIYDFACGALRSAIGKLPFFVALVVLVSDLFHIVNHLCSDALHPRSYSALDQANTVAHEQRNAPINLLRRTLRAVGQQEYMGVLKMENVIYNVMAHAKAACSNPLPESYNYRQYYFSRSPCVCGCNYHPDAPPQPPPPPSVPDQPSSDEETAAPWAGAEYEMLDV